MHTEGALEIARVVKNMSSLKVLDLNGSFDYSWNFLNEKNLFQVIVLVRMELMKFVTHLKIKVFLLKWYSGK
jgi:hypothetical protein